MRVVFFDAVHARPATEYIFSFPTYATRSSRLRKNYVGTRNFDSPHVWLNRYTLSQDSRARHARLAGRARLGGIQSVHVAPFSPISHVTRHGPWRWRTFSASCQEKSHAVANEARTDRTGLLRLRSRRGPGLPTLCRLLVGRNALPEHPLYITLDRESRRRWVFPLIMSGRFTLSRVGIPLVSGGQAG